MVIISIYMKGNRLSKASSPVCASNCTAQTGGRTQTPNLYAILNKGV